MWSYQAISPTIFVFFYRSVDLHTMHTSAEWCVLSYVTQSNAELQSCRKVGTWHWFNLNPYSVVLFSTIMANKYWKLLPIDFMWINFLVCTIQLIPRPCRSLVLFATHKSHWDSVAWWTCNMKHPINQRVAASTAVPCLRCPESSYAIPGLCHRHAVGIGVT